MRVVPDRRRPRPSSMAAVALVAVTLLTGCGGGDDSPDDLDLSEATSTPSDSGSADGAGGELPPGVPTADDEPPAPTGLEDTDAGAREYATYVFDLFQWATARRDLDPVVELGRCPGCEQIASGYDDLGDVYVVPDEPPEARRVDLAGTGGPDGDVTVVGVAYDLPAGEAISPDGEVVDPVPPAEDKFMEIAIRWEGGSWGLVDLNITD